MPMIGKIAKTAAKAAKKMEDSKAPPRDVRKGGENYGKMGAKEAGIVAAGGAAAATQKRQNKKSGY